MPRQFALLLFVGLCLFGSCKQPERWTGMVYAGETSFNHRTVGEYASVEDCLLQGKEEKGDGYLECGLNCRWDAQGLFTCEKTVRLMEHQEPR